MCIGRGGWSEDVGVAGSAEESVDGDGGARVASGRKKSKSAVEDGADEVSSRRAAGMDGGGRGSSVSDAGGGRGGGITRSGGGSERTGRGGVTLTVAEGGGPRKDVNDFGEGGRGMDAASTRIPVETRGSTEGHSSTPTCSIEEFASDLSE